MRISDWSSDVCSSDLPLMNFSFMPSLHPRLARRTLLAAACTLCLAAVGLSPAAVLAQDYPSRPVKLIVPFGPGRSEEHTSELQSLMRISYAVFCSKKKKISE